MNLLAQQLDYPLGDVLPDEGGTLEVAPSIKCLLTPWHETPAHLHLLWFEGKLLRRLCGNGLYWFVPNF